MSLQNDFELCLEYAETLESKRDQREQAQNNIIFMQNEGRRLKNKLRICTVLSVLSAVGMLFFGFMIISDDTANTADSLSFLIVLGIVLVVALFNALKTKKEFGEFEAKRPILIQQYTTDAEECDREITRLIQEIYQEDLFDIVPVDYFYTAAIEFCLTQVRKKLANTAKEAFQQLDAEIKRLEQMEYLEQMNNARMEQLNDIKRAIDINTLVTLAEHDKKEY